MYVLDIHTVTLEGNKFVV